MGIIQMQHEMNIQKELEFYKTEGYAGPYDLLDSNQINNIIREFDECIEQHPYMGPIENKYTNDIQTYWKDLGQDVHWFKSLHALLPSVRKLAKHPLLLDLIKPILGQDIMLWGSQIIRMRSGRHHKWHIDVETLDWESVNVWISLKNTNNNATLKLISKSHGFMQTPQTLESTEKLDFANDQIVLQRAKKENPDAELFIPSPCPGQYILFHGKIWHGSFNITENERTSILLQYSTPKCKARIPTKFSEPIIWHSFPPPCIMVHGENKCFTNVFID